MGGIDYGLRSPRLCLKRTCVKNPEVFVTDRALQSTLREWRRAFSQPITWVVFAGVAAVLAILAPFGTGSYLRPVLRGLYWLSVVASTYGAGLMVALVLQPYFAKHLPKWGVVLALGLATGAAIIPVMIALNLIAFGYWPALADWPRTVAQFMGLAMIISVVIQALSEHLSPKAPGAATAAPALLDRLPVARRGPLLSLSAEDHYTRVRTGAGDVLVLIRLSDAIRETAPVAGLQVHRSHWVALEGVKDLRKQGDGAVITLQDGAEIPVSRRYMPDIRAAGLRVG